ncbi:hypothetical protein [Vibrio sp. 10N.239.312.D08]|uniref:hypothetical protein n=1 Tax=Vibrio sp. 10N.239.312.D08 TaxID=3229978 RepID=UPI00354FF4D9
MTEEKNIKPIPEHISQVRKRKTQKQIKLRIDLLNKFILEGVPDGFTAHTSIMKLISYTEHKHFEKISYPTIRATEMFVNELDPSAKNNPKMLVNCKDYLLLKLAKVRELNSKQTNKNNTENTSKTDSYDSKNKPKTKGELRCIIKDQTILIESLARELLIQRSTNNKLITSIKELDASGRALRNYYQESQENLMRSKKKNFPKLEDLIISLQNIALEFNSELDSQQNNVFFIREEE